MRTEWALIADVAQGATYAEVTASTGATECAYRLPPVSLTWH